MLPNCKAPADEIMTRSAPSVTSPAAAFAAAYHGVRAAMPLDLLPARNPIVVWYCCRQPTITPRSFLPLLPAAGSTQLLCRAIMPYQTTPLEGCTPNHPRGRVHTAGGVQLLAERANNPISAASTTNLLKWSVYGK